MPVSDADRKRLQETQLQIATEIAEVCEKHSIRYLLLGGSALGARRHRGFIPWDDDVDMGMLREDFDRFVEVSRRELPERLYLQHWLDDRHMGAPFAKVRLNNTRMLEPWSKDTGGHKGIFVDIFPLDNVPDGFAEHPWKIQMLFWKRILRHQTGYTMKRHPGAVGLADSMVKAMSHLFSQRFAKRTLHRLMTRYRSRETKRVLAVGGAYDFRKDMLQTRWITNLAPLPFGTRDFLCSAYIDEYLTHMYGDFMTYPPVDERYDRHCITGLSFDLKGEQEAKERGATGEGAAQDIAPAEPVRVFRAARSAFRSASGVR